MPQIGVITEQNDLGLGFDPLNEKDQKAYQNGNNETKDNNKSNEK